MLDSGAQDANYRRQSLPPHRTVEASENLDLLDELALSDEGSLTTRTVDVALLGQVDHRLPDRCQAHAHGFRDPPFAGQLGAGPQPALLDALEDRDLDLMVERRRTVPVHLSGQPLLDGGRRHLHNNTKL